MKDIKKHFATFDSFVKMKLVPNVRDINDAKQNWLQAGNIIDKLHFVSFMSNSLQRRNSMASRTKKAAALMAGAGASPNLSASKKTAPFPATAGSGKTRSTTKWYEEIDYYDEEEIEEFNRETSTAKNSRHSLETDEEESDENEHEIEALNMSEHEHMRLEAAGGSLEEADGGVGGVMAKLFRPRQGLLYRWTEPYGTLS